jgi:hypothetical protein
LFSFASFFKSEVGSEGGEYKGGAIKWGGEGGGEGGGGGGGWGFV